jgi:hypothetical protein
MSCSRAREFVLTAAGRLKKFSSLGLEVRHLEIYSTREKGRLAALLTPSIDSHALTEMRTEKG